MRYKYSGIRRDYTIDYEFSGEVITAIYKDDEQTSTDTFDFSSMPDGKADTSNIVSDIPIPVIQSAERINGELQVVLFKPHGNLQQGAEFPNENWQVI